ncbi:MAG: phosphate signaling complex protein PhoU [Clostridiaceae bacterium]|nr:phosphate signaling complex protein PhoU [Clostridiaceae bacterium]
MRRNFDRQLGELNVALIRMGAACEAIINKAIRALFNHDLSLARDAVRDDKEIDRMEREIENFCLQLILQQQPVAGDLRIISSALKMITDLERIGDQGADIAEIISMDNLDLTGDLRPPVVQMAEATCRMVTQSIDAYVRRDLQLAEHVIASDDIVDDLFVRIRSLLIETIAKHREEMAEKVIDLLMIAKYFERIGDHATNIAEWVVFAITGHHKDVPPAPDHPKMNSAGSLIDD